MGICTLVLKLHPHTLLQLPQAKEVEYLKLALVFLQFLHSPLPKGFLALGQPFRDFLQLEDLYEPQGELLVAPLWKNRALITSSILSSAIWMSAPPYMAVVGDRWGTLRAAVQSTS